MAHQSPTRKKTPACTSVKGAKNDPELKIVTKKIDLLVGSRVLISDKLLETYPLSRYWLPGYYPVKDNLPPPTMEQPDDKPKTYDSDTTVEYWPEHSDDLGTEANETKLHCQQTQFHRKKKTKQ